MCVHDKLFAAANAVERIVTLAMQRMLGRCGAGPGEGCARESTASEKIALAASKKQIPCFARDDTVGEFGMWRSGIGSSAGFDLTNFVEALAEALLETLVGGLVVGAAG